MKNNDDEESQHQNFWKDKLFEAMNLAMWDNEEKAKRSELLSRNMNEHLNFYWNFIHDF